MPKLRVSRLPRRYRPVVTSIALSVSMTAVVSFIVTVKTVGLGAAMVDTWFASWQFSCAIAVPARFVVAPLVGRFVGLFVSPLVIHRY